jgi:ribosomal-protein-alanine N-acetyltransferase
VSVVVEVKYQIQIRQMRVYDLPIVRSIDECSFSTPWTLTTFRFELLENPNAYCWVAEIDETLVGFLICWLIIDEMHIATIAVHPNFRRMGIGKKLIVTGLSELIAKGAQMATLEVRAQNCIAKNLYQYFGFKTVGLRKAYYQDTGEDAILMTVQSFNQEYIHWLETGLNDPWDQFIS